MKMKCVTTTAMLALGLLVCSITSYAGEWRQVSKTIDGIIGVFVPCSDPDHQKSRITAWPGPDENTVADARAYSCCESARAYSKGTVTKTFRWFPDDPETDPPPFLSCVQHTLGFTHKECNLSQTVCTPVGIATSSLGSPLPSDPYRVVAYSWEDTHTGEITFTYELESDTLVRSGPSRIAFADVAVTTVRFNEEYPEDETQIVKVSPSKYRAMPLYPQSVRHCTSHANFTPGDPVNLATGEHIYSPGSDISVYNPYGPAVIYQRNFLTSLARDGERSPGLPVGWCDGFDIRIYPNYPMDWYGLTIVYPNDAEEIVTPVLSDGTPTGQFTTEPGSEYMVTGTPSSTQGQWDQITITHKDGMKWIFTRVDSLTYRLSAIANRMGRRINFIRDSQNGYRITSVQDDQPAPNTLLSFAYQSGYLSSLVDCYGRRVNYVYGNSYGERLLNAVSQLGSGTSIPARSTYSYDLYGYPVVPYLSRVNVPSPTGYGMSSEWFEHDAEGRVTKITDANSVTHQFRYGCPYATEVAVRKGLGKAESNVLVYFDRTHSNVITKIRNRGGVFAWREFHDAANPFLPTKVTDKLGKAVELTYDQYGNVLTAKSARGTVTRYEYDYSAFPLGRLVAIKDADNLPPNDPAKKPDTTICYFEPSGLLQSVTYPRPGTTGPEGERVTSSYTYDLVDDQNAGTKGLGNVLTVTAPGNNAAASIVTTYSYGPYAEVKLGLPRSVTDNLGHTTLLEYDPRGNVTSSTDALGRRSDFTYNVADQMTNIVHPPTAPLP